MAGRRPAGGVAKIVFTAGKKVEYYSKSYDEWIVAIVGLVHESGNLRLLHDDGSVMKENADVALVRLVESSPVAGAAVAGPLPRSPPMKSPSLSSVPRVVGASPRPAAVVAGSKIVAGGVQCKSSTPQRRISRPGSANRAPSPSLLGAGMGVVGGADRNSVGSGGSGGGVLASKVPSLSPPARQCHEIGGGRQDSRHDGLPDSQRAGKFYPGDRIRIRESGREGIALYVGTPNFSTKPTIGMQLDEKRSKSDCDGKAPTGERLFRCPAGFGIFLAQEDVELIKMEGSDSFPSVPAPEVHLDVESSLSELVGLRGVKDHFEKVQQLVKVQKQREALGVYGSKPMHFAFVGSHGTGMTRCAQLLAHHLRDMEVLASGQLIKVSRKELLAGDGPDKQMPKVWKAAAGGVLMVTDVHLLHDRERSRDTEGLEASEFLAKKLTAMAAKCSGETAGPCFPQEVCVILTFQQDSTLPVPLQRAPVRIVDFPDYSNEELLEIVTKLVKKRQFSLDKSLTKEKLLPYIREARQRSTDLEGKNINMLQHLLDKAIARQTERAGIAETVSLNGLTTLAEEDFIDGMTASREESIKAALQKLKSVVGLANVKSFIESLYAQLRTEAERRDAGITAAGGAGTLHMIFSGNPGTGKTTVARIVADLLAAMGLLRKGHLVEADRASLVAGYSGQTALKTRQVVESALGGVLFVDEAYALVSEDGKDSFGKEALDTLIKMIEDHRQDLVVILAGYSDEMVRLVATNPGVKSRFPTQVVFDDYSDSELMQIAEMMLHSDGFLLSQGARKVLSGNLKAIATAGGRQQGNGRAVRNLLEQARRRMAVRLQAGAEGKSRSKAELCTLEGADFET